MKIFAKICLLSAAFTFISAGTLKKQYVLAKDYSVTIHGTSNLHAWDETVGLVSGNGTFTPNSDGSSNLEDINIKMEVRSIRSSKGAVMNNNTYKALKADVYPQIIFSISSPVKSIQINTVEKTITAKGNLTIAGVTKPVNLLVKIVMLPQGRLLFEGSQSIKMTDYNIKPPTALLGTLKTGNEITIRFKTSFILI
ncbi:MAG TPA: YceI family protein [Bacteroidia bacterium]|nr:YceI family protein [Bacteroidia bacterium]